jgi:hypothetical protein
VIPIQATFTGYGAAACTLFSAYDADARVLVIDTEAAYRAERRAGCIVLTNQPELTRDSLFTEEDHLEAAIAAFHSLKTGLASDGKSSRLAFSHRAARATPENAIEQDGLSASGHTRYRISTSITNAQMAALATCWYAVRSDTISRTVDMAADMADFQRRLMLGQVVTI